MLVVVENWDIALFLELPLNLEAAGRGNILEVHAAERARNQVHGVHKFVHVVRLHAKRERVHVAKALEEHALSFHDRHARLGSDVAKAQNRRAVGNDRAEIPAARKLIAFVNIFLNLQARLRHTRRIRKAQIILRLNRNCRFYFNFTLPLGMQPKRFLRVIHHASPYLCRFVRCLRHSLPFPVSHFEGFRPICQPPA